MKAVLALCAVLGATACAADTTQARLRTAVDARQGRLDGCYAKALARADSEAEAGRGKMRVILHVPKDGDEVSAVDVTRSELHDKKLQRCVRSALVGANLGGPSDDDLRVEYTLAFRVDTNDTE